MEVNINNAFPLALKLSFKCCVSYDAVADKIINLLMRLVAISLKNPVFSTIIFLLVLFAISSALFISIFIVFGLSCFVLLMLLIEGILVAIALVLLFLIIQMGTIISILYIILQERIISIIPK